MTKASAVIRSIPRTIATSINTLIYTENFVNLVNFPVILIYISTIE